jgi:outer membrane cobalamin receptor
MKAFRSIAHLACATSCRLIPLMAADPPNLTTLPETVVIAPPLPSAFFGSDPTRENVLLAETLRTTPSSSLDSALRQQPGFRLFRRTDSVAAHPTTQGVSLGNVGPNGASRTVVLQDGIPINDPFGGWVPWTRYRASDLTQISLLPDGGVSPWGIPSLGGTIALESRALHDTPFLTTSFAAGNRMPYDAAVTFASGALNTTRWFGSLSTTDFSGYPVIRASQRGTVDSHAGVTTSRFDLGFRRIIQPDSPWQTTARVQGWDESRGNGTPLGTNRSRALDLSARLDRRTTEDEWAMENILFHQERRFASTFTAIAPDRSAETLTLDQHNVPSRSTGLIQRIRLPLGDAHQLGMGWDTRVISGTTHEHFFFQNGNPLRERNAGGRQSQTGIFLVDTLRLEKWTFESGARLDRMNQFRGRLLETNRSDDSLIKDERYANATDVRPSYRLGARWQATPSCVWRIDGYTSFRFPTLNELYRPFRVGSVTTSANPALGPEEIRGISTSSSYTLSSATHLHTRFFFNHIDHAIANLTTSATTQQRNQIDRTQVRGAELRMSHEVGSYLTLDAAYAYTDSKVARSEKAPQLVGKSLPQVPSHQASIGIRARMDWLQWTTQARWNSTAWDDDLNRAKLQGFVVVDSRADFSLDQRTTLFAAIENIANTEIMTRREPDSGLISVGTPRMWSIGIRREF